MADIAIFDDEAFSVATLTAAINEQPYLPGRISSLGLFQEEGIATLTVQIEKDGDTLALVPAGERGTSGLVVTGTKRRMIPFNTVHLPERFTIRALVSTHMTFGICHHSWKILHPVRVSKIIWKYTLIDLN